MKTYLIKSDHAITLDSFKDGEIEHVNWYNLDHKVMANNPGEAVKNYIEDFLCYSFYSIEQDEFCGWYADFLVDNESIEASESEISEWKKDKLKLYNNHVNFEVYELNHINPIKQ